MALETFLISAANSFNDAARTLPMTLLQSAALVGLVSTLLLFRGNRTITDQKSCVLGATLGISSIVLTGLMSEWLKTPIKTLVVTDFIFLAGFLGGWRNAFLTAALAFVGRALFGGSGNLLFVVADYSAIATGSSLLQYFFSKQQRDYMTLGAGSALVLARLIIVETPLVLLYFISPHMREITTTLMTRRIFGGLTFSVFIVFCVIYLLRREQYREQSLYLEILSGLPNRRALQKDLEESYSKNKKKARTLLLVDISNFRDLVQELGHDWADAFFQRIGGSLTALTHEHWLAAYTPSVYCFSDRSFVLVLQGIRMWEVEDQTIAHRVYSALIPNSQQQVGSIRPWLAIGVFELLPNHIMNPNRFLRTLTLVERSSEAPVRYFEANSMRQIQREARIRKYIEEWILAGRVPLWLQPKVFLKDGRCVGAEALLREWEDSSESRYISPPEIFSIAATHRMLGALEWATVKTIVSYLEQMPPELQRLPLSINLSPTTLSQPGFGARVCALLKDKKVEGRRLVVEIIETSRLSANSDIVQDNFHNLSKGGVQLSLDDFGTGYASISLLSRLPFDELKLDYSMISNMDDPRTCAAITLSLEGARRYNASVVAEGVETPAQRQRLLDLGIEVGQGFLFGKAMDLADFVDYTLRSHFEIDPAREWLKPALA